MALSEKIPTDGLATPALDRMTVLGPDTGHTGIMDINLQSRFRIQHKQPERVEPLRLRKGHRNHGEDEPRSGGRGDNGQPVLYAPSQHIPFEEANGYAAGPKSNAGVVPRAASGGLKAMRPAAVRNAVAIIKPYCRAKEETACGSKYAPTSADDQPTREKHLDQTHYHAYAVVQSRYWDCYVGCRVENHLKWLPQGKLCICMPWQRIIPQKVHPDEQCSAGAQHSNPGFWKPQADRQHDERRPDQDSTSQRIAGDSRRCDGHC